MNIFFPHFFPHPKFLPIFAADQPTIKMNFAFYLKDKRRKAGTQLVLVVTHKGKTFKKQIGISVKPDEFKKQRTKDEATNAKLRLIEVALTERLNQFSTDEEILSAIDAAMAIKDGRKPDGPRKKEKEGRGVSFWQYFREWSERPCSQMRQRKLCYHNIEKFMGRKFDWADVDSAFHFRLVQKMQGAGFALNYQWRTVSQLKTVMNEGYKLKYHTNTEYQLFKTRREEPDTVYLTREEVDRLWDYQPKGELDRKARDLFLLGVYTAARFSDYSRLTSDMIQDGVIRFHQVKTAGVVLIPASPRVMEILERNGGRAPHIEQQHLNEWIKKVCAAVSIDSPVEVSKTVGAVHETQVKRKYELVTSHTARRTGATLLYMTGVPLQQVMLITGHKDEKSIRRYLRLTREENVAMLKDNPFFK